MHRAVRAFVVVGLLLLITACGDDGDEVVVVFDGQSLNRVPVPDYPALVMQGIEGADAENIAVNGASWNVLAEDAATRRDPLADGGQSILVLVGGTSDVVGGDEPEEYQENRAVRALRRVLPLGTRYDGGRLRTVEDGKRVFTPLVVVFLAIGSTDLLFAFDSIPAIFGLTQDPFIVFTTNVFALMGLRQLYFLLGGLLERLVYLPIGLAVILGFIGVKLVLEALHENTLPFINGGQHLEAVPTVPIWLSLVVIVGALLVTTVASLVRTRALRGAEDSTVATRDPVTGGGTSDVVRDDVDEVAGEVPTPRDR